MKRVFLFPYERQSSLYLGLLLCIMKKVITGKAAKWLTHLNDRKKQFFTSQETAMFINNPSKQQVNKFLADLVQRGLAIRIKRGLYAQVPYEVKAKEFFPNWHATGAHLAGNTNYYIGYYSALQMHSLTTQPSLREQIVVNKQILPAVQEIHDVKFQFIYHNEKHFFGTKKKWADSYNKVVCSDLEKTIIDCLYKPDYAFGIVEIAKAIYKSYGKINCDTFLTYIEDFGSQAVIKRFGYLVELYQLDLPIVDKLQELISPSLVVLDPTHPKEGKINSRWRLYINTDTETILQAPHT